MSDKEASREAEERIVAAMVEEALAAYGHLLTPEDRAFARELVADLIATHPVSAELIEQIVPPRVVERSDKVAKDDVPVAEEPAEDDQQAGGSR